MKILIICNFTSGLYKFRGMLIDQLVKRGHELHVIIPQTEDENEIEFEKKVQDFHCNLIRIPMERRGMNPIKDLSLMKQYHQVIKELKPDHVITYTIKPNIYAGLVCKHMHIPYSANITGLGTAFQNDGMLKTLVTTLYKHAFKKCHVVLFENTANRDIMVDLGIVKKEQTYVLHGAGVDLDRFKYAAYPNNEIFRFLFIGRVMREKGIDELFSVMKRLNDEGLTCQLDVVGGYEEDYSDTIKEYEADGWLKYHGYQKDVTPFIQQCDCFVLPSWHEGMANTNLECASTGRPLITSHIPGCQEAVEDKVTGYLTVVKNPDDLYEKMKDMLHLTFSQREEMGKQGRSKMEREFDKKQVVKETIDALKL